MAIKSRLQLFKDLNVTPKNPYWAWCAIDKTNKRAVFTLWEDLKEENSIWLIHDDNAPDDLKKRNGYKNQKETIDQVLNEKHEIFGIVCVAKNPKSDPRKIKEIKSDFVYELVLIDQGTQIFAKVKKTSSILEIIRKDQKDLSDLSGLQDLDTSNFGSDYPDRALTKGYIIKRDRKVRQAVISRANGKCEYCGGISFKTLNGQNYLEAHHIIFLAKSGTDRMDNVIALCPSHHREAHFGMNAENLEKEFLEILERTNL